MNQQEKQEVVVNYLNQKYGPSCKVDILSIIWQSWGMIGDHWEAMLKQSDAQRQVRVYAEELESEYKIVSELDYTGMLLTGDVHITPEDIEAMKRAEIVPSASDDKRLDQWQLERLCNIVYLDSILEGAKEEKRQLSVLMKDLEKEVEGENKLPGESDRDVMRSVLDSIKRDSLLMSLRVIDIQEVPPDIVRDCLPGQRVVTFMDQNNGVYLIYRGTYGNDEWLDNGKGMLQEDTIQQKAALNYLYYIKVKYSPSYTAVAGHSKGGNKAQYVSIVSQKGNVDYGLSIDGQGFSPQFMKKYADNIHERSNIHLIAEQRDFVNCLGLYLHSDAKCKSKETVYYRGWRGHKTESNIFGDPLMDFHRCDALRLFDSSLVPAGGIGHIPLVINDLVADFLISKHFTDFDKNITIEYFMSLMMNDTKIKVYPILSIGTLLFEVADLLAKDDNFAQKLEDTIYLEQNVICASILGKYETTADLFEEHENQDGDISEIICLIARLLVSSDIVVEALQALGHFIRRICLRIYEVATYNEMIFIIYLLVIRFIISLITTIMNKIPKKDMTNLIYETLREESGKILAQLEDILKIDLESEIAKIAEKVYEECKILVAYFN